LQAQYDRRFFNGFSDRWKLKAWPDAASNMARVIHELG
jgi:hypothetical protein